MTHAGSHEPGVSSVRQLAGLWPSLASFAEDVGVSLDAAKQMRRRGSIAVEHWPRVIAAAKARGLTIDADTMMRFHGPLIRGGP